MPSEPDAPLTETIRSRNERRCERLLGRSELLDTSDVDWHAAADVELDRQTLATLVYMRDVEGFTPRYLDGLGGHASTRSDPLVSRFLDVWEAEELAHARALERFIVAYAQGRGIDLPAPQPPPPHAPSAVERIALTASRPIGHVVTATHMAWGATNELLTLNGYRMLAEGTSNPVLESLLSRIAAQESRHYGFYYLQAEWRLAESRLARRVVPRLLRRAWTPVGVGEGFKRPDEFEVIFRHLLGTPGAAARLRSMDRTIARLPGCDGLGLLARAADAVGPEAAVVIPAHRPRGRPTASGMAA